MLVSTDDVPGSARPDAHRGAPAADLRRGDPPAFRDPALRAPPAAPPDGQAAQTVRGAMSSAPGFPRDPNASLEPAPSGARRRSLVALVAVLISAAALRLWRLGHGLPDLLDEDYPFRRALAMWGWETGRTDWNPHFFFYPSLSIYLHFLVQKASVALALWTGRISSPADYRLSFEIDPTPMVLAARACGVACDVLTVLGVARLAERLRPGSGPAAGLLAALSPVLILTSRAVYCDTQLAALSVWALERMLAWRDRGGRVRLAWAVALVGLAAGAKYPGALLVVPLVYVLIERRGRRGLLLAPAAAAGSLVMFLLTSPYVALDFAAFRRQFGSEAQHMATGHLGHLGQASFALQHGTLAANLGWAGLVALAGSLVLAFAPIAPGATWGRGAARVLWSFALPFGLAVAVARAPMERYLAPVIAVGCSLAVAAAGAAFDRLGRWRWLAAALALSSMLLPVGVRGVRAARGGGGNTQGQARAWCEAHLGRRDLLLQEGYGAALLTHGRRRQVVQSRYFQAASAALRRRYLERAAYHVVALPLLVSGRPTVPVRAPSGDIVAVEIFPFAADFTRVFYDPRLLAGVDYVLTSSAVRGRYEAEPQRYQAQTSLYRLLDREAEPVARFSSHGFTAGPEIRIYRLGPAVQGALGERYGVLPLLWWAESIPIRYRDAIDRLVPAGREAGRGALRTRDGRLAPWVQSLAGVYQDRIAPFAGTMARELGQLGRLEPAERLVRANLALMPDDEESFGLLVHCVFRRAPVPRAKAIVESTLVALAREDSRAGVLRETYDWMLAHPDQAGLGK